MSTIAGGVHLNGRGIGSENAWYVEKDGVPVGAVEFEIDWVWSPGNDAEFSLMDRVVAEAARRGCTRVRGEFIADGSNEVMREFLAQFGFTMMGGDESGTLWILPVAAYEPMGS
jgi:hypothetical protein